MENNVLSIKGIKQLSLHCGPACIEMVLRYFGYNNIKQRRIGKDIKVNLKEGCYTIDIIRYLKRYNIITEFRKGKNVLKSLTITHPIVICTRSHFMLLVGKENEKYIIINPASGNHIKKDIDFFKKEIVGYIIVREVIK